MIRLGLDIDGVLADFNEAYAALVEQQTGITLELPPKTWNYVKDAGIDETPLWRDYIIPSKRFWLDLKPYQHVGWLLRWLHHQRDSIDTYFITSRPGDTSKYQTELWLIEYGMHYPTVLVSSKKGLLAAGLGLDVMVDDKPENLFDVKEASPSTETWLFDAAYNGWAHDDPRISQVMPNLDSLTVIADIAAAVVA